METAHTSNERMPLLGNGIKSNEQRQLIGISVNINEQTPLDGSDSGFNAQAQLDESHAASNEHLPTFGEGTSNSDTMSSIISCPRAFERKIAEVSKEEVVQAMFSAWLRNRTSKSEITLNYFTIKDFYAMHVAWKNVTRGRRCSSLPHKIAEAVATEIAKVLFPRPQCDGNTSSINYDIEFAMKKNLLTANLLEVWGILNEELDVFPVRYIETIFEDSDEQPPAVSEYWLRKVELYDKVHDFILNTKLQILLHTLLFIWHVSILVIGSKYMECPMGHHLSYLLMILGCIGCLAIIFRLALMQMSPPKYPIIWFWEWNTLRVIEFTFLIVFIVQAIHFFKVDLTIEPDPKQCVKNFYRDALVINYVSIPLASAYVLAYSAIFCVNQFDVWHWIIRYL